VKLISKRHGYEKRDNEPAQVQAYFDSENPSKFDMGLHDKFALRRVKKRGWVNQTVITSTPLKLSNLYRGNRKFIVHTACHQ